MAISAAMQPGYKEWVQYFSALFQTTLQLLRRMPPLAKTVYALGIFVPICRPHVNLSTAHWPAHEAEKVGMPQQCCDNAITLSCTAIPWHGVGWGSSPPLISWFAAVPHKSSVSGCRTYPNSVTDVAHFLSATEC